MRAAAPVCGSCADSCDAESSQTSAAARLLYRQHFCCFISVGVVWMEASVTDRSPPGVSSAPTGLESATQTLK